MACPSSRCPRPYGREAAYVQSLGFPQLCALIRHWAFFRAAGYHSSLRRAAKPKKIPGLEHSGVSRVCVSISIQHCVERDFLDRLRADLAASTRTVDLLSPFVSPNRSSDYYPVFMALSVRSIPVRAYVRPRSEQPESLRPLYPEAIRNLESRGVQVLCRPGMHEKVAAVDGRILWHGSLNILSHNDSRESMLRFESRDLVNEVLKDLGIFSSLKDDLGLTTDVGAPPDETTPTTGPWCSVCGGAMRLFATAGILICNASPRCPGIRSIGSVEIAAEAAASDMRPATVDMNCPICQSPMIVKGIPRRQIACPSSACGFQLEPRLSSGILRILCRREAV